MASATSKHLSVAEYLELKKSKLQRQQSAKRSKKLKMRHRVSTVLCKTKDFSSTDEDDPAEPFDCSRNATERERSSPMVRTYAFRRKKSHLEAFESLAKEAENVEAGKEVIEDIWEQLEEPEMPAPMLPEDDDLVTRYTTSGFGDCSSLATSVTVQGEESQLESETPTIVSQSQIGELSDNVSGTFGLRREDNTILVYLFHKNVPENIYEAVKADLVNDRKFMSLSRPNVNEVGQHQPLHASHSWHAEIPELPNRLGVKEKEILYDLKDRIRPVTYNALTDALAKAAKPEVNKTRKPSKEQQLQETFVKDMEVMLENIKQMKPFKRSQSDISEKKMLLMEALANQSMYYKKIERLVPRCAPAKDGKIGQVLIINNTFKHDSQMVRTGSAFDEDNVKLTFRGLFLKLFKNTVHKAKNQRQFRNLLQEFTQEDHHKNYGCCAVVLMSHGEDDHIYLEDSSKFQLSELQRYISTKSLKGKLKLVVINACRGGLDQTTDDSDLPSDCGRQYDSSGSQEGSEQDAITNMFLAYSTLDSFAATRDPAKGSWYIEALCKVLNDKTMTNDKDLKELFDEVHKVLLNSFRTTRNGRTILQSCQYKVIGMEQPFFFFPYRKID